MPQQKNPARLSSRIKKTPTISTQQNRHSERGNVFLFILLGVVLFAALAFTMSRGFRSDTTTAMSERQAELLAVDVIAYTQLLERAIARMQQHSVSENDLSFENETVTGYEHTPPQAETHQIFHADGGNVTWRNPPTNANDGSQWHFTGRTCIADIGSGATGCSADSTSNEELIVVLPNVNPTVCSALDKKLGIATIPSNSGNPYSTTKFTGTFADGSEIITGASRNSACYKDGSNYHFYSVLIGR